MHNKALNAYKLINHMKRMLCPLCPLMHITSLHEACSLVQVWEAILGIVSKKALQERFRSKLMHMYKFMTHPSTVSKNSSASEKKPFKFRSVASKPAWDDLEGLGLKSCLIAYGSRLAPPPYTGSILSSQRQAALPTV